MGSWHAVICKLPAPSQPSGPAAKLDGPLVQAPDPILMSSTLRLRRTKAGLWVASATVRAADASSKSVACIVGCVHMVSITSSHPILLQARMSTSVLPAIPSSPQMTIIVRNRLDIRALLGAVLPPSAAQIPGRT